ncbi:MAG: hypothetical protein H8E98_06345 [Bacteroidetes bacterium]|nr:hypothetical protein [Bacteroidota bacterium]
MEAWMDQKEIDFVISYLTPNSTMLEWGSGGSTITFSNYVKLYYSIEHNLDWYVDVRKELVDKNIENVGHYLSCHPKGRAEVYGEFFDKWREYLIDISQEENNNIVGLTNYYDVRDRFIWKDYIDFIDRFETISFDFIFIDGQSRPNCAKKALDYIGNESIVFIHDYFKRPQYHVVEQDYEIIGRIEDTLQTIVALKPKSK